jgi:large subunit ribosomal protein L6
MSRIGKLPVAIPANVQVNVTGDVVVVKGGKSELKMTVKPQIQVRVEGSTVYVTRMNEDKATRAMHGLIRAVIANMIKGVVKGYEKKLEIRGVGFRIAVAGRKVTLSLGFSHPVEYHLPDGIEIEIDKENKTLFTVRGADKRVVGQVAAELRAFRKPEPYKGKGIRYFNEYVKIKQGKTAAKAA